MSNTANTPIGKINQPVIHIAEDLESIDNVKDGEYVDMGAGLFYALRNGIWRQIDGGYGIQVSTTTAINDISKRMQK